MIPLTYREWLEQVAARTGDDGRFAAALLKRLERNPYDQRATRAALLKRLERNPYDQRATRAVLNERP